MLTDGILQLLLLLFLGNCGGKKKMTGMRKLEDAGITQQRSSMSVKMFLRWFEHRKWVWYGGSVH